MLHYIHPSARRQLCPSTFAGRQTGYSRFIRAFCREQLCNVSGYDTDWWAVTVRTLYNELKDDVPSTEQSLTAQLDETRTPCGFTVCERSRVIHCYYKNINHSCFKDFWHTLIDKNTFANSLKFSNSLEKLVFSFNSAEPRLYKTLKCKAIHFLQPAHSGFNSMGWAIPLYLPCCIFKAAILNLYIFFHCHEMRLTDRAAVDSLRIKIGRVAWTRYVPDHQATCFLLTSPITTNYLALGFCVCHPRLWGESQNTVPESNWKIIAWLLWPRKDLLFDDKCTWGQWNGNEGSTSWVFCGSKQRNAECFNICQSKQRKLPKWANNPRAQRYEGGRRWSKNQQPSHQTDCNYSASNSVMKGLGLRLQVPSPLDERGRVGWGGVFGLRAISGHLIFSQGLYLSWHRSVFKLWDSRPLTSISQGTTQWLWALSHPPIHAMPQQLT